MCRFLGRCPGFSCGSHTPNRLLGRRDGAQGFHADTPQTAERPSGQSTAQRHWTRLPGSPRNFFCVWCTRSSTETVCSVWLQELSRSARCRNGARPPTARQRPQNQGSMQTPTHGRKRLQPSSTNKASKSAYTACSARPRTRQGTNQSPLPVRPISATLRRYAVGSFSSYFMFRQKLLPQLVIPKPPQTARGSTLVLSQEPRPKQGIAARQT